MFGVWCRVFVCLASVISIVPSRFLALLLSRLRWAFFFFSSFLFWNTGLVLYYIVRWTRALEC